MIHRLQRGSLAAMALAFGLTGRAAAQVFCPCDPPPYPGASKVKDAFEDNKLGQWELRCTNQSETGDFVWTYTPVGGPRKVIGRCIFVGGQNRTSIVRGPDGNVAYYIHTCVDGGTDDGQPWDAVMNVFDKEACVKVRLCLNYVGGHWVEDLSGREWLGPDDFAAFPPNDSNGDGVPDEGFKRLTDGLYPFPPPPLLAEFETRTRIKAMPNSGAIHLRWEAEFVTPILQPGDSVFVDSLDPTDVISVDPSFTVLPTTGGVEFRATAVVTPSTNDLLATVVPTGDTSARYFVVENGADAFWNGLFASHPGLALQDLATVTATNFSDLPGSAGSTGFLDLSGLVSVPTLPTAGLALLGLGLAAGFVLIVRRRVRS